MNRDTLPDVAELLPVVIDDAEKLAAAGQLLADVAQHISTARAMLRDGEPWFVAADVCAALDIQNATQAVARLDDEDRAMFSIAPQGETNAVNESGLYSLILGSRKPEAKPFKRWVTSEVLPAIRKTGGYARNTPVALPDFSDPVAAARAWADATEQKLKAETALALAAPKVELVDRYMDATGTQTFRQVASDAARRAKRRARAFEAVAADRLTTGRA